MRVLAVAIILIAGGLTLAQAPDDVKQELDRLEGSWSVQQAEMNGKKSAEEEAKRHKLVITTKDRKLTIHAPQGSKTATIEIDPTKRPRSINLIADDGKDKGRTMPGIYSLEGDTLKLCFREKGSERPKDFATQADSGLVLFVVRRMK